MTNLHKFHDTQITLSIDFGSRHFLLLHASSCFQLKAEKRVAIINPTYSDNCLCHVPGSNFSRRRRKSTKRKSEQSSCRMTSPMAENRDRILLANPDINSSPIHSMTIIHQSMHWVKERIFSFLILKLTQSHYDYKNSMNEWSEFIEEEVNRATIIMSYI